MRDENIQPKPFTNPCKNPVLHFLPKIDQQKETISITKIKERQRNAERRRKPLSKRKHERGRKKRGDELIRYRLALPDLQRIKWGNARDGAIVRKHRIEKRNLKPMSFHLESVTGCRSISCASSSGTFWGKKCNTSPRQRSIKSRCRTQPNCGNPSVTGKRRAC